MFHGACCGRMSLRERDSSGGREEETAREGGTEREREGEGEGESGGGRERGGGRGGERRRERERWGGRDSERGLSARLLKNCWEWRGGIPLKKHTKTHIKLNIRIHSSVTTNTHTARL